MRSIKWCNFQCNLPQARGALAMAELLASRRDRRCQHYTTVKTVSIMPSFWRALAVENCYEQTISLTKSCRVIVRGVRAWWLRLYNKTNFNGSCGQDITGILTQESALGAVPSPSAAACMYNMTREIEIANWRFRCKTKWRTAKTAVDCFCVFDDTLKTRKKSRFWILKNAENVGLLSNYDWDALNV